MAKVASKPKSQGGLDLKQQIKFLKKIDFFENFDDHELRQFLSVTKWLKVPAGKQIIKENTMERVFYILVRGQVSVVKTVQGGKRTVELTTLDAGACFGEMSLVMDVKRTAGVVTKKEAFILMVEPRIINSSNVFLQLKFYKRFCEILVSRLIQANEKVASYEKVQDLNDLKEVTLPSDSEIIEEEGDDKEPEEDDAVDVRQQEPEVLGDEIREDTIMVLPALPKIKDRIIKKRLQRNISAALDLPGNPVIAIQLRPLIESKSESTRLFADLILLDPVFSSKVMQVANSSFFRRSTPVATVPHAMITVGMKQIQEAIADPVEGARHKRPFSGFSQIASQFWRHSVVVARIATMLKDTIRITTSDDVYLAGLLHDLGILALDPIEPNFYPNLLDKDSPIINALSEAEIDHIGIDHGQAGAWFGESIGLPTIYQDVMRFHHSLGQARENTLVIALVHLADIFATLHGCGIGCQPDPPVSPLGSLGWVIIQDEHRPFLEVNITDFVDNFNKELEKTWSSITDGLNF